MAYNKIKTSELVSELDSIARLGWGDLPIYTLNENNYGINDYDFSLSSTMEIGVEDILTIDERVYIKSEDYDDWFSDKVDGNDDYLIDIISKRHPELKDEVLELDAEIQDPIIYHYYMNDLPWEKVVLITNWN